MSARILLALTSLACIGCSYVYPRTTIYSSVSPDQKAELLMQVSKCFADCALHVVVKQGSKTTEIASASDCSVQFAHAAWDGSRVAVYVDGSYCGSVKAAYDIATGQSIDFQRVDPVLRASIVKAYTVTPDELKAHGGDVLSWASYPGDGLPHRGPEEFQKRFKHAP